MCLAIPAKITEIKGMTATVDIGGNRSTADISVLPDVKIGDYIMVHAGFAIQKYRESEALENLALLNELFDSLQNHG